MKKNKIIYIFISILVILILIALIFFLNNSTHGQENEVNKKIISEIDYLENYIVSSLNKINNIDLTKNEIENQEVDWENLKRETEKIYISLPTITLDLYSAGIEQEKILSFNKDLDEVIKTINNKDKTETGIALAKLYSYLPNYLEEISSDIKEVNILKTKSNLFNGYSLINSDKWNDIYSYINLALENFAIVIGNSQDSNNSFVENKCYIELNEILNSVNSKDKETFLIKYKNLVEDLENL